MTIDQHLIAFEASLQAKGDTAKQIRLVTTRCRKLIEAARFQALSEITGEKVSRALANISDAKNLTSRTKSFYLKAFTHFCIWAVNNDRMGGNPTKNLTVKLKGDIKKRRRPLTVEEVRRLVTTTADGPVRHGICGPDRALLYVFAGESGGRIGDIVALRAGDFGLSDELVNVTILAAGTKNRKDRELLLSPGLSAMIRRHLSNKMASAKAFSTPRPDAFAKMLRKDLLVAGINPVDGGGREVDFHALRTTSASLMISQGFDVKTAQQRLGHHDPALTLKGYTMTYREGEEAAVKSLPDLTAKPSSGSAKATGTDAGTATANRPDDRQNRAQHPAQHARNISVRQGSSSFVMSGEDDGDGTSPKYQEISEVTAEMRDDSSSFVNPRDRTRICDLRGIEPPPPQNHRRRWGSRPIAGH